MKIHPLLKEAARFAKDKIIAYHGTDPKNLKTILSQGLIPQKADTGWGRDDESEDHGYSLHPMEGSVYFTKNYVDAISIARDVSKDYKKILIVVAQIQPKTAYMDEDSLTRILNLEDFADNDSIKNSIGNLALKYDYVLDDDDFLKELDDLEDFLVSSNEKILHNKLINLKKHTNLKDTTINKILQRAVPLIKKIIEEVIDYHLQGGPPDIREYQNELTRLLKSVVQSNEYNHPTNDTFRIEGNIGYKGANKIIGFINPAKRLAWGEIPDNIMHSNSLQKVDHPLKLYEENKSSKLEKRTA